MTHPCKLDRVIIEAPTNLGLHPGGVEEFSSAILEAGFAERLNAPVVCRIDAPAYDPIPDPVTGIKNVGSIVTYSRALAHRVGEAVDAGHFPIVLGGDCSVLLGGVLALRRRDRYGLIFIDGQNDCYDPLHYAPGEAAAMDLAHALGIGPDILTDIDSLRPYVREADTVVFGNRDELDGHLRGRMPTPSGVTDINLCEIRRLGADVASENAALVLHRAILAGVWLHIDVDVLNDDIMPAVDYRRPDGLTWAEFETSVQTFLRSGLVVGMDVTIFNPALDPEKLIVRQLTDSLLNCFA